MTLYFFDLSTLSIVVCPYKDPVKIHHMKKFFDKVITGFFVFSFGVLGFCNTKYYVKPNVYDIVIYDVYGNESKPDGIRAKFRTQKVAPSYISEYQKGFPHLIFSIRSCIPEMERKKVFSKILKKDYK